MKPPLKKSMFHLAWSPESLPTSEAIAPLVEYLDVHLVALNSALLATNFSRVLQAIWEVVLGELCNQMDGSAAVKSVIHILNLFLLFQNCIKLSVKQFE